jgi:hypothetical protein
MNKGYALGFLIVLLVIVLGLYVAITGFMSSREVHRAQSAAAASTQAAQPTRTPTRPIPTPTETAIVIPSPVTGLTVTMTAMVTAVITDEAPPTEPPTPPPTEAPPARPTDTPPAVVQPPTPAPAYQFRLAGPPAADPNYQICCYVYGTVKDAAGNGLEGVQVQAFNEWTTLPPALTKGGGEIGKYDIPIGRELVNWYVVIVDQAGNQISSQVQIQWNPDEANGFRVDWQRTY